MPSYIADPKIKLLTINFSAKSTSQLSHWWFISTFWEEKKQKRVKTNCSDQQKHAFKEKMFSDAFS